LVYKNYETDLVLGQAQQALPCIGTTNPTLHWYRYSTPYLALIQVQHTLPCIGTGAASLPFGQWRHRWTPHADHVIIINIPQGQDLWGPTPTPAFSPPNLSWLSFLVTLLQLPKSLHQVSQLGLARRGVLAEV